MKLLITMKQCEETHSEQGFSNYSAADERMNTTTTAPNKVIRGSETTARPLKKAKYAWQVKGKGRNSSSTSTNNNNNINNNGVLEQLPYRTTEVPSTRTDANSFRDNSHAQRVQYNMNSCSDRTEAFRSRSGTVEDENVPSSISEESEVVKSASRVDTTVSRATPEVGHHPNNEMQPSYSLHRWQSKQMAQGIIDNAINNVLGDMGITPLQPERYSVTFGDPSTWGHYLNAQNIENEGVAEAIRQQGLQRRRVVDETTAMSSSTSSTLSDETERRKSLGGVFVTNGRYPSIPSSSSSIPLSSSECVSNAIDDAKNSGSMSYNGEVIAQNDTDVDFEASSSSSLECDDDEKECEEVVVEEEEEDDEEEEVVLMQQEDLLNTAVSCAINSKGLGVLTMSKSQ